MHSGLKRHHREWLLAHPMRSGAWLKERLSDGFDVHHLDGDHGNNSPDNLVLIEAADHMMLHGMVGPRGERRLRRLPASGVTQKRLQTGCAAYELAKTIGDSQCRVHGLWSLVAGELQCSKSTVYSAAKLWAAHGGLDWPIRANRAGSHIDETAYSLAHEFVSKRKTKSNMWLFVSERLDCARAEAQRAAARWALQNNLVWPLSINGKLD